MSDSNRYSINCTLNISYGNTCRQKLDIYGVNLPASAPILVYVHGGYWQGMNKYSSSFAIKPYIDSGYKMFIPDFDLCPDSTLTEVVRHFQKCAEYIFNYAKDNSAKSVNFIGHSSGAHLITFLLNKDFINRIGETFKLMKNIYLISGVYDLRELKDTKSINRDNLLSLTDNNVKELSPLLQSFNHLHGYKINIICYTGGNESPTMQQQTRDFVAHLKITTIDAHFTIVDDMDHFNIVERLSEKTYEITRQIIADLA